MAQGLHAQEARAFSARLKQALEAAGVRPSPAVVASEFNLRYWGKSITAHTARAWLAGLAIPTQDKIRTLSEWLHVNPDELRFGARSGPVLAMDSGTLESLPNLQDRQMLAHCASCVLMLLAVFWPVLFVYPAGLSLVLANGWLLRNLLSAMNVQRAHLLKIDAMISSQP